MTIQPFDIAIDVGDAQPQIDWTEVFDAGIRIAMIKASEGNSFKSPVFDKQVTGATAAGIKVIPYHFLRPGLAQPQVEQFCDAAQLGTGDAFALDWEGRAAETATPEIAEAVGDVLSAHLGRLPLGYWGIPGSTPAQPTVMMATWDRWIPRYPMTGQKSFAAGLLHYRPPGSLFWQYTCWGQVPGIPVAVDRSVGFANSVEELLAWCDSGKRPV